MKRNRPQEIYRNCNSESKHAPVNHEKGGEKMVDASFEKDRMLLVSFSVWHSTLQKSDLIEEHFLSDTSVPGTIL
jgi:hypothetical protein